MTATGPAATELDERFSSPGAAARPWSDVVTVLEAAEIFWLSTVRRDERPHVTPLPAIWLDGALHFCVGADEQKARNLEANQHCVLTTGGNELRSGFDLVVEGRAVRVMDASLLEELAAIWRSKLDWPFEAVDGGFRERMPEGAEASNDRGTA